MFKTDLIKGVSERASISMADAHSATEALFAMVKEALAEGQTVTITDFGTFTPSVRKARSVVGFDGKPAVIPEHKTATFRVGAGLKRAMNPPKRKRGRPKKNK